MRKGAQKYIACIFAFIMILSLNPPNASATSLALNKDVMSQEDMVGILNTYQAEIEEIEENTNVSISSIDKMTVSLILDDIRTEHHGESRFMALYNAIALACTEYDLINSVAIETRGQGRVEIIGTDHVYGPEYLYGECGSEVPVGVTNNQTIGISISAGTTIAEDYSLSVGFSISKSQSFSGPPYGYQLPNGTNATHGMPVGFCYGSIIDIVYKYIDNESGKEWIFTSREIDSEARMEMYTMVIGKPSENELYVAHIIDPDKCLSFSSEEEFREEVRTDPTQFF